MFNEFLVNTIKRSLEILYVDLKEIHKLLKNIKYKKAGYQVNFIYPLIKKHTEAVLEVLSDASK